MGRIKYLVRNIWLLMIGQFSTKILVFFLVPLYTSILSTSEYGTYDLINSAIGFLIPLLTLNVSESVLRFSLDEERNISDIFSIGCKYILIGNSVVFFLLMLNRITGLIPILNDYGLFFGGMFLTHSLVGLMTVYARGIDRIADLSISGIVCTSVVIGLNILFLCFWHLGLPGYFLANIVGTIAQLCYLIIRTKCWRKIRVKIQDSHIEKQMLGYCIPFIANSIAWWVNNLSDRYVIVAFYGLAVTGVYSVASKIPAILDAFQSIFNQAWILSAVKDFDPDDRNGFFSALYNSYNCLMVLITSGLITTDKILSRILFAKDFYAAWKYVPFLLIALVFGALSGYIGGIFSAVKKAKQFAKSTVVGAISNLLMNLFLVYHVGVIGAAIATAISYWVVYLIRVCAVKKYMKIQLCLLRDHIAYIFLIVQTIILLIITDNLVALYMMEFGVMIIEILLFINEIKFILYRLIKIVKIKDLGEL